MDKSTPPISKPEKFGVSNQEVIDLAAKLREGLPAQIQSHGPGRVQAEAAGLRQPAPRAIIR